MLLSYAFKLAMISAEPAYLRFREASFLSVPVQSFLISLLISSMRFFSGGSGTSPRKCSQPSRFFRKA